MIWIKYLIENWNIAYYYIPILVHIISVNAIDNLYVKVLIVILSWKWLYCNYI